MDEREDTAYPPEPPRPPDQDPLTPPVTPPAVYAHERPAEVAPPSVPPAYPYASPTAPSSHGNGRARSSAATIAIAALLAFIIGAFTGLAGGFLGGRLAVTGASVSSAGPARKIAVVPSKTTDPVVAAAAAAVPSVVNIDVRASASNQDNKEGLPNDHPNVPMVGNGSGVAFRRVDGGGTYIITNNHVVEGATTLTVRDSTGRSEKAQLVGHDPETDIAVVRVKSNLPVMATADSSRILVGQTVVAIGSPFGLEHSVTAGVISALGRSLPDFAGAPQDSYPLIDVIQTDAAINPGNSGGALVNRDGKLIGINTAIYSDSGASGGIGFAVPVNTAVRVANQLIRGKEITHPFLGIIGQTVTAEFAKQERLDVQEGAWVSEVTKGSGAAQSGIRKGDVVTRLDGQAIRSMDDLILQVRRKRVGDDVSLVILRGGKRMTVKVQVGDKPSNLNVPETSTTPSR